MNYPGVDYPTIVAGKMLAPVRFESLDGSEFYHARYDGHPQAVGSNVLVDGLYWNVNSNVVTFINFKPFVKDGKTWQVSTIQKQSKWGWLKTKPDCYYRWHMWELQAQVMDQNGVKVWKPGSEFGIYFRKPFSWRWDVAGTIEDGALRHFVWTRGYLGGHYD